MSQSNLIRAWRLALSLTAATVALAFPVALLAAEAQQTGRPPRIGILFLGSQSTQGPRAEVAREELRKLGYIDGKTVILDIRFANGRLDRVRGLATELVNARVDVILTAGTSVVQEIRPVAANIPIVASMVDPVSAGFAESFAHPGGNITGVAFQLAAAAGRVPAGATVVCTVTGHGLKDPEWAIAGAATRTTVPADAASVAGELGL